MQKKAPPPVSDKPSAAPPVSDKPPAAPPVFDKPPAAPPVANKKRKAATSQAPPAAGKKAKKPTSPASLEQKRETLPRQSRRRLWNVTQMKVQLLARGKNVLGNQGGVTLGRNLVMEV